MVNYYKSDSHWLAVDLIKGIVYCQQIIIKKYLYTNYLLQISRKSNRMEETNTRWKIPPCTSRITKPK